MLLSAGETVAGGLGTWTASVCLPEEPVAEAGGQSASRTEEVERPRALQVGSKTVSYHVSFLLTKYSQSEGEPQSQDAARSVALRSLTRSSGSFEKVTSRPPEPDKRRSRLLPTALSRPKEREVCAENYACALGTWNVTPRI